MNAAISTRDDSQDLYELVDLHLLLTNDEDNLCYVDCIGTVIHQVLMVIKLEDLNNMVAELRRLCPDLRVDETEDHPQRDENHGIVSSVTRLNIHSSQSKDVVMFSLREEQIHTTNSVRESPKTLIEGLAAITAVAKDHNSDSSYDGQEPAEDSLSEIQIIVPRVLTTKAPEHVHVNGPKMQMVAISNAKKPLQMRQRSGIGISEELVRLPSSVYPVRLRH